MVKTLVYMYISENIRLLKSKEPACCGYQRKGKKGWRE